MPKHLWILFCSGTLKKIIVVSVDVYSFHSAKKESSSSCFSSENMQSLGGLKMSLDFRTSMSIPVQKPWMLLMTLTLEPGIRYIWALLHVCANFAHFCCQILYHCKQSNSSYRKSNMAIFPTAISLLRISCFVAGGYRTLQDHISSILQVSYTCFEESLHGF